MYIADAKYRVLAKTAEIKQKTAPIPLLFIHASIDSDALPDKLEFVIQREMNREENAFLSSHP